MDGNSAGRLVGRVCVITGTASGVGRATARRFAAEGAHVVGVDINADGHRQTARQLEKDGHRAVLIDGDVNDDAVLDRVLAHCERQHSKVDVLFNNAVLLTQGTVDEVRLADWEPVMNTNVRAPLRWTQAFAPLLMRSGRGSIINHSSIDGVYANPHVALYSISKAALGGLTRATAASYADHGMRANAIASGNAIRSASDPAGGTAFADTLLASAEVSWARMFERLTDNTPGRRSGTVEELAGVALFLASDDSTFVNGATILVDGGRGSLTPGTGLVRD